MHVHTGQRSAVDKSVRFTSERSDSTVRVNKAYILVKWGTEQWKVLHTFNSFCIYIHLHLNAILRILLLLSESIVECSNNCVEVL